ncbi:hypothetical protein, partial [Brevibacillus laterosporus]|uniref:hypothetical protein n=1 Tax=Brevibacillus laterosporus TaxID=1465 RepID=UPI00215BEA7B
KPTYFTFDPSETKKIKLLLAEEKGMNEQMKAFSYRLLSTIVHDRTRSAGLMRQVKVGEPQHGIQETEMYTTPKIMARGTAMVVRAFEIAGMSTLEHCGGDPEAFKSDVRNASQRWIEIAEVAG